MAYAGAGKDPPRREGLRGWRGTVRARLARFWRAGKDVTYGMALHDMERLMRRQRADREHLFVLIVFGDILGVPILPPYYTLRLLPFIVPEINAWRRRLLREKDLTDLIG
jgi:hypothetical protein